MSSAVIGVGATVALGVGAAGAAATVYSANAQKGAASDAANAQQQAAQNANATQLYMYNQTRNDQAIGRQSGNEALSALDQYYGLADPNAQQQAAAPQSPQYAFNGGGGGPFGLGMGVHQVMQQTAPAGKPTPKIDFNKQIQSMPGYKFNFDQGEEAVQRNLAARGLLDSGAAGKALTQYGQGYATSATQQYLNGLQSLAGIGQTANQATGAAGSNAANQIGSNQIYAGNAQASGYANQANAVGQGLAGLAGIAGRFDPYQGGSQGQQNQNWANSAMSDVTNAGYQASKRYIAYDPGLT